MAKAGKDGRQKDDAPAGGPSMMSFIISVVLAILIGVGGGGAFGYFVKLGETQPAVSAEATPDADSATPPKQPPGRFPDDALDIGLAPIIVELESEPRTKVRLELSMIAAHGTSDTGAMKDEVREDVIAFMKGLKVGDIQGVRGFQNLRQQLEDRARIRGHGAILGLLIGGLVLE